MKLSALSAGFLMALSMGAQANPWDEPWHGPDVARTTGAGLFRVDRASGGTAHPVLVKQLAGEPGGASTRHST